MVVMHVILYAHVMRLSCALMTLDLSIRILTAENVLNVKSV